MDNSWNSPHFPQGQQTGQVGQVKLFDPTQFQTPAANVPDLAVAKQPQGQAVQNPGNASFEQVPAQNNWGVGGQGVTAMQPAQGNWGGWGSWDDWSTAGTNAVSHNQQPQQQLPSQSLPQQQYMSTSQNQGATSAYHQNTSDGNANTSYNSSQYSNAWDSSWDGAGRMYAQPNQYANSGNAVQQPGEAYYGQPYSQPSYENVGNQAQVQGEQGTLQQDQSVSQSQPQNFQEPIEAHQENQSFTDGGQSQVYYDQPSIPHEAFDPSSFADSGPWLGSVMDPSQNQQGTTDGQETNNPVSDNISGAGVSNFQFHNVHNLDQPGGSSTSANLSGTGNSIQSGYGASPSQNVQPSLPNLDVYNDNDGDGTVAGFFGRGDDDGDVSSDSSRPPKLGSVAPDNHNTEQQNNYGNLLTVDKSYGRTNSEISNASLSTFNMSATEDDGREHLQNLQELVQRMENVDIAKRNAKEGHTEGTPQPPVSNAESTGYAIPQPTNLPLDTELRSASPDLGPPESSESGGSGASGGSSGLTDWEIVPSQSQMTHSRSNSLDNNVNVFSSPPDNQIDGPSGEIKDGGVDRSIPQSSSVSDEGVPHRHEVPTSTQDQSLSPCKPPSQLSASPVNPPPFSSSGPPPLASSTSECGENPFRRGGQSHTTALSQPPSTGATPAVPVLSKANRSDTDFNSDSSKPKSISALPSKPKLSTDDGAPPARAEAQTKSSGPSSDTAKKTSQTSDEVSLSSRRHQSAFHPVHRVRQNTVSPATTLWENSDSSSSSNILLAPAMPLIIPALNPYSSSAAATASTDVTTNSDLKKSSSASSITDRSRNRRDPDDQYQPHSRNADRRGDRDKGNDRPRDREDANRSFDSLDELNTADDSRDRSYRSGREPRSARDDRPNSRSDYPSSRDRNYDRPSSRTDRPSSRNDSYRDEGHRRYRGYYRDCGNNYYDERYDRPRSRQDELQGSRPSSRLGQEVDRPRSRTDYEREADYYYRDRNRGYYDNYGRHPDYYHEDRERYQRYYREKESRYSRGYYDEYYGAKNAEHYQQHQQPQQQHQPSNQDQGVRPGSRPSSRSQEGGGSCSHSQSRGNTPGVEHSQGDYYGRGSRPPSRADYGRDYYSRGYAYDGYAGYYEGYGYDPYYGYGGYSGYEDSFNQAYDQGRMTPPKYSYPHVRACFGPNGQLIKVLPNRPADGQPAIVEIQDVQSVLESCRETEELQQFPGPLTRINAHKKDVLYFCQQKAKACMEDVYMVNRESAQLIWKLLELLIKQNGVVVGTDLSELLLEGHEPATLEYSLMADRHSAEGLEIMTEDSLDDDSSSRNSPAVKTTNDRTLITPSRQREDWIARFRHLLLYGRKKDALECAMKNNLWGHALFLASKMDTRTHASVMTRFANSAMKMNDPLQTLYQLMSGRQPASVTGIMDERWGDWRPHLAMILSNQSSRHALDCKSITTLGDTLASKGYLHASHFCYLMAQVPFGSYLKKTSKIVLIGANHYLPLEEFASPEVIQCTEIYEYAQSLNNPSFCLVHFQIFKYMYACKLIDHGMAAEALLYCEVIASTICQYPTYFQPSFVNLVDELSTKLKYADPQRQHTSDDAEDPMWMQQLHNVVQAYENGTLQPGSGSHTPALNYTASGNGNDSRELTPYQQGDVTQYASGEAPVSGTASYDSTGFDPYNQQYQQQQAHTDYQTSAYQPGEAGDGTGQQGYAVMEGYQQQQSQQMDPSSQQVIHDQQQQQQHQQPHQQQQPDYSQWQQQQQRNYQYPPAYGSEVFQPQPTIDQHETYPPQYSSMTSTSANFYPQPTSTVAGSSGVGETGHQTDLTSSHTSNTFSQMSAGTTSDNFTPGANISTNETEEEDDGDEDEVDSGAVTGFDYFGNTGTQKVVSPPHRYRTTSSSSGGSTRRRRTMSGSSTGSVKASPHKTAPPPSKSSAGDAKRGGESGGAGNGWFGGLFSKFGRKGKNEMILPDDKKPTIVWDPEKEKWINTGEPEKEEVPTAPPPRDIDLAGKSSAPTASVPGPPAMGAGGANRFSLKAKGARNQYVDVNNPKPLSVPQNLFNVLPTTSTSSAAMPQVMLPGSVSQNPSASIAEKPATGTGEEAEGMLNVPAVSQDLSRSSSLNSVNQEVQRITGQTSHTPDSSQQTAPTAMPVLFNPASLSKNTVGASSTAARPGLKYGQRRAYPK